MRRGILTILTAGLLFVAGAGVAWSGTYYIAANGSDSNNGTSKSSPWVHAPGMPNCTGSCGSHTPNAGDRFIFRGGDTWHFGNSAASPYTGGTWDFSSWWGTRATCLYEGAQTGCIYYGVDPTWYVGASWARPILTADNPTSLSPVASCAHQMPGDNEFVVGAPNSILDNFEMLGLCGATASSNQGVSNGHIVYHGTGTAGDGTLFLTNLYIHGWTETSAIVSANQLACNIIGGGFNGLQVITKLVIDGSDSNAGVCTWGQYPSFYHFTDSIIRYTSDGVGQWCHDIHDNIFEHIVSINNNPGANHTNILECNSESNGTAPGQPANTPNVFYNNIVRHSESDVGIWFCPNTITDYWYNNVLYDVRGEGWSVAGPSQYPGCTLAGGQFEFNNTIVDLGQGFTCHGTGSNNTGGIYTTALNNHLINTPWDGSGCTGGPSGATNVSMTTATATAQGYVSGSGTYRTSNCASDSTTPCAPSAGSNSTVGAGGNLQTYCTTLASYSSEPAIGIDAANACKYGTTDGCAYNTSTHAMVCPGQTATARPTSSGWDAGAYQYAASGPRVQPTSLGPWTNMQVINQTLTASNFTRTVTWSKLAGSQPTGLGGTCITGTTGTTCTLSGTLSGTSGSPFSFTIRGTDGTHTVDTAFNTIVNDVASITASGLPNGQVGSLYSQTLSTSGGTGAITCSVSSGLPAGLSIAGCTISGSPTAAGVFNFTVTPQDANGVSGSGVALSITIGASTTSACSATLQNWDNSPVIGFPDGSTPPASNKVSLTANIHAVGDLVAVTVWCFPPSFTGGCTPVSVTLGSQTAVRTTVGGQPDPGTQGTPGSGQGWIYYVLSAASSGPQTLTFNIVETQQLQVSYMDFQPSAGCTFSHDVDSPRGFGGTSTSITSPSITPTQGDLLFNFTWTSSHMVDPIGSPWVASIWQPQLSQFLENSVNAVTYVLSAPSGSTSNNLNTLHNGDSWQALITSFAMHNTKNPPPNPPTSLTGVVH